MMKINSLLSVALVVALLNASNGLVSAQITDDFSIAFGTTSWCLDLNGDAGSGNFDCKRIEGRPCVDGNDDQMFAFNPNNGFLYSTALVGATLGGGRYREGNCGETLEEDVNRGGCLTKHNRGDWGLTLVGCSNQRDTQKWELTEDGKFMMDGECLGMQQNVQRGFRRVMLMDCDAVDANLITWVPKGTTEGSAASAATTEEEEVLDEGMAADDMDGTDGTVVTTEMLEDESLSVSATTGDDNNTTEAFVPVAATQTLADLIATTDGFSIIAEALKTTGLDKVLSSSGPFTVLAPYDYAFGVYQNDTVVSKLFEDGEWIAHLTDLLSYHVMVEQFHYWHELAAGLNTEMGNGETADFAGPNPVTINDDATVVGASADWIVPNGILYGLDNVLMPSWVRTNIVEAADSLPEIFSSLTDLLATAQLVEELSGDKPYTVFAPANDAFKLVGNETLSFLASGDGYDSLVDLLYYHIYPGIITSEDLVNGAELIMANGGTLKVTVERTSGETTTTTTDTTNTTAEVYDDMDLGLDGDVETAVSKAVSAAEATEVYMINDEAKITSGDILVNNGIIHVIDAVLMPQVA